MISVIAPYQKLMTFKNGYEGVRKKRQFEKLIHVTVNI